MHKGLILPSLMMLLAGCAVNQAQEVNLKAAFNTEEAKRLLAPGKNTIKGSALFRQNGGGIVSCAGTQVDLVPATEYATERISYLYGSTERGVQTAMTAPHLKFTNVEASGYRENQRHVLCDSQGFFKFDNVADGSFYLTSVITWHVGNSYIPEGGVLMQRITVSGGEVKEIVLAPPM